MDLPATCPICETDLRAARWPQTHGGCRVRRADLEEWVRTGGGLVAQLLQEREDEQLDEDLLLLFDDDDD